MSNQRLVQSSSSGNNISAFFEKSSSLGKGQLPGLMDKESQDYPKLFNNISYVERKTDFLEGIRQENGKQEVCDVDMGDFWKMDNNVNYNNNYQSINIFEQSRIMQPLPEEDPFRLSLSLGTSMLLRKKTSRNFNQKIEEMEE